MIDLTVVIDDSNMSPHAIYVVVPTPEEVRITVAPNVEAEVLAVLPPDLGQAVADAIEAKREEAS